MHRGTNGEDGPDAATACRSIVEAVSEAIIFADRDGTIRLWNRGAEQVFGWSAGEALGRSLDIIIPEKLRRAHWHGYVRAMDSGTTKHSGRAMITRSVRKDGSTLYVDMSFAVAKDASGAVLGAVAVGRDATERHAAEAKARARIRELETRLGTQPDTQPGAAE